MSRRAVLAYVAVLTGALWWLRAQLITEVGVSLGEAMTLGLPCGVLLDLAMVLVVGGTAICIGADRPRLGNSTAAALSIVLLGFTTANVAYFGYFDARLERWVIAAYIRELPEIHGSLWHLLATPVVFVCVVAVPLGVLMLLAVHSMQWRPGAAVVSARRGAAFLAVAAALVLFATAIKHRVVQGSSILADQVFVSWIEGEIGLRPLQGTARRAIERTLTAAASADPSAPAHVLAALRDWNPQNEPVPGVHDFAAAGPLVRTRAATAAQTRALRVRLGLPTEGAVHIVVLFLESVRAFEMEHPAMWPSVFPRTRALLAQHGLRFPTAYSSAWGGAQTVEAQFETLNSMLPNFRGPAIYRAYPDLQVKSLAAVARDHGYRTVWIAGSSEKQLNKRGFESRHGTERFFGLEYLSLIPFEPTTHDWCGYPDERMLQEAVRILQREAQEGRPVFANVLTVNTHHPVTEIPEGPVPPALRVAAMQWPADKDYVGYLSRLRYLDESLHKFFTALFAGPLGDRTLVVLLGDHGQRYTPHLAIARQQQVELMMRVPFAIVTKRLPAPGTITYAIHQIDVAPTVADIAGFRHDVPWIGRNALDGAGSPWVLAHDEQLHYRFGDRACYTLEGDDGPRCYRVDESADPMLRADLSPVRANPAEVKFFQWVTTAAHEAIARDQIMPAVARR
jgi:arylsulfatase A-like enzyme